jgi:hypothetical protein
MAPAAATPLPDLWDEAHAAGLDEPGLLLHRSNLLGSDLRVTNFGGGNTSALVETAGPFPGVMVKALWFKGSSGDPRLDTSSKSTPATPCHSPARFRNALGRIGKTPCPPSQPISSPIRTRPGSPIIVRTSMRWRAS